MGAKEKNEEKLFTESKESVEDVFGWKILIFLPQNPVWKVLIMITVSVSFVITTTKVFYLRTNKTLSALELFCDSFYFMDTVFATLHFGLEKTRRLRHAERRPFIFLLIDYVSLVPLNLLFEYLIYREGKKSEELTYILRANVIFRSYQVPLGFSDIKKMVYKMMAYYLLTIIEVFVYFGFLTHFFGCFIFKYFDKALRQKCLDHLGLCIIENDLLSSGVLTHNYIDPISNYPLKDYKLLLIMDFFIGFIFRYGFVTPLIIYLNMEFLREFFEYLYKRKQLALLIQNMTEDKVVKKKLTDYFHYTWTYGKSDNLPDALDIFPLCFRKTIFCDVYWEALRHSYFLQSLSVGCKRSLALHMKTEFVLPKTILFQKQTTKIYFMYLESGLVQVMSEENSESPVLNLSEGTVLGEISFFFQTESKALMRTKNFSTIHMLKCSDLLRVLLNYPKDMKKMYHKMKHRLKVAKALHKSKTEIYPLFLRNDEYILSAMNNIKWLKYQFRALFKLKQTQKLLMQSRETIFDYRQRIQFLETQLQHTSLYLPLLCIADEVENIHNVVCVKSSFPWFLEPKSHFLIVWNIINNALAFVVIILYPAFLGWFPIIPTWFFNISVIINFFYIIDVLIQVATAVTVKGVVIPKFSTVVSYRFSNLFFCLDIVAALPLYLTVYFYEIQHKPFELNRLLVNALVKSYRLLPVMNKLHYNAKSGIHYRATAKFILILCLSIYWAAAILNVVGMKCVLSECREKDWFSNSFIKKGENYDKILTVFAALYLELDLPSKNLYAGDMPSFAVYFIIYILSIFLFHVWQGDCIASYVLENFNELEYVSLMEQVNKFMLKHKISKSIKNRVMATLDFQWNYDKGNYITQKRRIFEDLSADLRDEIDRKFLLPILQNSRPFKWEDEAFLVDLCRKANRLAVPANSLLVTFGTQTMTLYIIHKGHVQLNSFVVGDSRLDVSTPIVYTSGDSFPVLVALSQIPSPITAITLTDCELLCLDLEDILATMVFHKVLPDAVLELKQIDLTAMSSARVGISRIKETFTFDKKSYQAAFKRIKYLGPFLKIILLKNGINPRSLMYVYWELFRNLLILFNLIGWPIVFGCCSKSKNKLTLIYSLLIFDCISSLFDLYLRVHIGYYNNLGIFVLHPLATLLHYLTTTFSLDLIAFIPNFHMIHLLKKKQLNFGKTVIIVHMVMRSLSLYRILGLLSYIKSQNKKFSSFTMVINFFLFGFLALHYYINFLTYLYIQGERRPSFSFTPHTSVRPNKPHEYYFYEFSLTTSFLLQGQTFFDAYNIYNLVVSGILGILATLFQTFMFSFLTLSNMNTNKNFIIYRYYFKSFVKYLNEENVESNSAAQAIKYFDFKWQESHGVDLQKVFPHFPNILHEDILFSLYKDTLSAVKCLSKANEAFYRALCRHVKVITLMKASEIIFEKQVQADIFFIHKGKCFVKEKSKTLIKGAIMGDIHNRGFMKHTITALTQVALLRIPSKLFFVTIGNFYNTRKAFELEVANADDFIDSIYVDRSSSLVEIESIRKQDDYLGSEFEPTDPDGIITRPLNGKKKRTFLKPESLSIQMLDFLFFIDAYTTFIVVPIFIGTALLTWWALTTVYLLDAVWIVKIILTTTTAAVNTKTKENIYNAKTIFLIYLNKFDGIVLHVLSVLPIELIALAYYGKSLQKNCHVIYYCYVNRLLRIPNVYFYVRSKLKDLLANVYLKLLNISLFGFALVNLFVSINLLLRRGKEFGTVKCDWGVRRSQVNDIINSYFFVMNHYVGAGILVCLPETPLEIFFQLAIEIWSFLSKAVIVNQILVIFCITHYIKSEQIFKLQQLEKYLLIRDVSPALFQKMQKYGCNLLNSYREGAHPRFLKETPTFIKMKIMKTLYMSHLSQCYIFQGSPEIFLQQLVIRLEKFIFFPGDYLVEKGDVDQNMYFIHKGEVKCLELDPTYPVLERTVDLFKAGDCFGIMQGMYLSCPHLNTYRAKVLTDVLVLNYYKWKDLRLAFPDITNRIYKRFQQSAVIKE